MVLTDFLVLLLTLTNVRLLATSRLAACIQAVAFQAVLLAAVLLSLPHGPWMARLAGLSVVTVVVKGVVLPRLLRKAMLKAGVQREIEPFLGYTSSVLIGTFLLGLCFVISAPLQPFAPPGASVLIPGAMFTILTGLFIIVSRKKALTQVVGYLVMENGVYAFGTALAVEAPLIVEMGILLDVFVAVFVMGIVVYHINREFDHINTDLLSELKD